MGTSGGGGRAQPEPVGLRSGLANTSVACLRKSGRPPNHRRRQPLCTARGFHGTATLTGVNESGAESVDVVVPLRAGFPQRTSAEAPPTRNTDGRGPDPPAAHARPFARRPLSPAFFCFGASAGVCRGGCQAGDQAEEGLVTCRYAAPARQRTYSCRRGYRHRRGRCCRAVLSHRDRGRAFVVGGPVGVGCCCSRYARRRAGRRRPVQERQADDDRRGRGRW